MNTERYNLLLADDDDDDCLFFKEALDETSINAALSIVHDGVQLMDYLKTNSSNNFPDVLFLDLNMPRKNGIECLAEIKADEKLKNLPVIIFSTSLDSEIVNNLYKNGASYYIRKPGDFSKLKKVIEIALTTASENNFRQPERAHFILQP
ncbi:response regulator [Flavobacterium phragmitis]|uniref:Response regulator receiver domain-containing protein n=1 Tax=Flavobacterium phragmitis TaxID=739143 RepID=A0A1I1NNK4_9FLAO|nr:response regulator [Flavobacterium phragmitis]SFC96343.1 Response regulator receiver domain-containing protein [Flavobacterium phragmitis]